MPKRNCFGSNYSNVGINAPSIVTNQSGSNSYRIYDDEFKNYTELKTNTTSNRELNLPDSDGTAGQAIITDGAGALSFSTVTTAPAGSDTQLQYNNAGVFGGVTTVTYDGTDLNMDNDLKMSNGNTIAIGASEITNLYATKTTYDTAGVYNFTVPLTENNMTVKLWGSSGGSGYQTGIGGVSNPAKCGGYVDVTLTGCAGKTYYILVGESGEVCGALNYAPGGGRNSGMFAGGDALGYDLASPQYYGAGGQASALFEFTGTHYILRAVAHGGGGSSSAIALNPSLDALDTGLGQPSAGFNVDDGKDSNADLLTTGVTALNLCDGKGGSAQATVPAGNDRSIIGAGGGYGGGGAVGRTISGYAGNGGSYTFNGSIEKGTPSAPGGSSDTDHNGTAGLYITNDKGYPGQVTIIYTSGTGISTNCDVTVTGDISNTGSITADTSIITPSVNIQDSTQTYKHAITSNTTSDRVLTLPDSNGTANQLVKTDGSGNLSYTTPKFSDLLDSSISGTSDAVILTVNGTNNNTYLGGLAGNGLTSTGTHNTAIGCCSGKSLLSAVRNTCLGSLSGQLNTTGADNTALGYNSLPANTAGGLNTCIGSSSLKLTTSIGNTAVGYKAGQTLTTGNYNTFLGYQADTSTASFTNVTAIGNGSTATASNQVMIGDASVTEITTNASGSASFKSKYLDVMNSGNTYKTHISSAVTGADYNLILPSTGGTLNQVLKTDASGNLSWTDIISAVAGSDTYVQYNDSGSLGADSGFTYNKTTHNLSLTGIGLNITPDTDYKLKIDGRTYQYNSSNDSIGTISNYNVISLTASSPVGDIVNSLTEFYVTGSDANSNKVTLNKNNAIYNNTDTLTTLINNWSSLTAQSGEGAITSIYNYYSDCIVDNALSPTVTTFTHYIANSPTSTGTKITNAYGININDQKVTGVTNGYGVYQAGASDLNYFNGNTGLGVSPDGTYKLKVTGSTNLNGDITSEGASSTISLGSLSSIIKTHTTRASVYRTKTETYTADGYGPNQLYLGQFSTGNIHIKAFQNGPSAKRSAEIKIDTAYDSEPIIEYYSDNFVGVITDDFCRIYYYKSSIESYQFWIEMYGYNTYEYKTSVDCNICSNSTTPWVEGTENTPDGRITDKSLCNLSRYKTLGVNIGAERPLDAGLYVNGNITRVNTYTATSGDINTTTLTYTPSGSASTVNNEIDSCTIDGTNSITTFYNMYDKTFYSNTNTLGTLVHYRNHISTASGEGTITKAYNMYNSVYAGNALSATITDLYYNYCAQPQSISTKIGTIHGLYIDSLKQTGVTTAYGINQVGASDINYFNGPSQFTKPIVPGSYTVATLPAEASYTGGIVYVSDGAAGSPILAFSDGTNWLRSDTGTTVASS